MSDFNARVIDEFRSNYGQVGGGFTGAPMILLTTTGAKSGKLRTHPLVYLADDDRLVIFASKAGPSAGYRGTRAGRLGADPAVAVAGR